MKKIILNTLILISLSACSQKKETMINQNQNITADNILAEIEKQVKHYPNEKIYAFSFSKAFCYIDIFVNDIQIYDNFNDAPPMNSAFEINPIIFKRGKQHISYRIYPIGKSEDYEKEYNTLVDETKLQLELNSYDLKNEDANDIIYMKYDAPQIEEKITENYSKFKFVGTGKKYYEGSFDINVDVPYELNSPFENAQDLRKMDKKELEAKLLKEYNKIRNIYQNKEKDNIAKLMYDKLRNQLISEYASPEKVKKAWEEMNEIIFKSDIEMLPIEKYEMRFFGNGKLVALYADSSNPDIRGGNALVCHLKSGFGKGFIELKHFFYIPQGETEFKVY